LQPDPVDPPIEALERDPVAIDPRHHRLAVLRRRALLHDHQVARVDAVVGHGVAAYVERKAAIGRMPLHQTGGDRQGLALLDRDDRLTGTHQAEQRQLDGGLLARIEWLQLGVPGGSHLFTDLLQHIVHVDLLEVLDIRGV
jgi:hypothetical protein